MLGLGMGEISLLAIGLLLLLGPKKLPEFGSSLAKGIRNFKTEIKEIKKVRDTSK